MPTLLASNITERDVRCNVCSVGQISFGLTNSLKTPGFDTSLLSSQGVEATLFATLMSILNGGAFTGSALGAVLTKSFGVTSEDFTNLAPLVTVCTLSSLLPLPLLKMLPVGSPSEQMQSSDKQSESA